MNILTLFAVCVLSWANPIPAQASTNYTYAQAPDFTLRDTKGKKVSLADYKGRVVLINFWATWCAPCIYEIPHLEKIYKEMKGEGVVVLGINLDEPRNISGIKPLAKKLGITYPVLLDSNKSVASLYNPDIVLPFNVIISPKGEVYAYFAGYYPGMENEVKKAIEEAIDLN
tara:strand:+ start:59 stop:571 length:513 start_codon:yes stop_codon:yes gene_type:complete